MILLVAPTEPKKLQALGKVDSLPEKMGVDYLLLPQRIGWQRKAISDFIASINGDRLAREVNQMSALNQAMVLIEGQGWWTVGEGMWVNPHAPTRFTRAQFFGILASLQQRGVWVMPTHDLADTARCIKEMMTWFAKDSHVSLSSRPNLRSPWGTATNEDWLGWVYQSWPIVGPVTAAAMVKALGPRALRWGVTYEELCKVPGVGKVKAAKLWTALGESVPEKKQRGKLKAVATKLKGES